MKVRIDVGADTDLVALVSRDEFMPNVDPDDLACRESATVLDWYHRDWFRWDDFGDLYFTPPAFECRNGHACCINGRHRTVLLFRHQALIPMLLVEPDLWPFRTLAQFVRQVFEEGECVEIPNLSINWDAPADLEWPDSPSGDTPAPKVDINITMKDHVAQNVTSEQEQTDTNVDSAAASKKARGKKTRGNHDG